LFFKVRFLSKDETTNHAETTEKEMVLRKNAKLKINSTHEKYLY